MVIDHQEWWFNHQNIDLNINIGDRVITHGIKAVKDVDFSTRYQDWNRMSAWDECWTLVWRIAGVSFLWLALFGGDPHKLVNSWISWFMVDMTLSWSETIILTDHLRMRIFQGFSSARSITSAAVELVLSWHIRISKQAMTAHGQCVTGWWF